MNNFKNKDKIKEYLESYYRNKEVSESIGKGLQIGFNLYIIKISIVFFMLYSFITRTINDGIMYLILFLIANLIYSTCRFVKTAKNCFDLNSTKEAEEVLNYMKEIARNEGEVI